MKAAMITNLAVRLFIIPFLVFGLAISPHQAQAQDSDSPGPSEKFSREELAQMLAPIALYPDALLSQVLMASTYPIEVIEADRWVRKNPELTGEILDDAILDRGWDPSIKALCHFPSILALMSERIAETTNIGNAFLVQEAEVMDMVQELRTKAYAQGNLNTTTEQKVIIQKETIIIEPADPRVIYVPYYDPYYIYGPWWYPAYPPYYWGPARVSIGIGISYWPAFYLGFAFGTWGYFDWHYNHIYINVHNRPRYVRHDRWLPKSGRWSHSPRHRRGVAYRDKFTARKYGQYPSRTRNFRPSTRGFPERIDRNRRIDGRTGIDRNTQGDGRLETNRTLLERQRIDRNKLERAKVQPPRQEGQSVKHDRQQQQTIQEGLQPEQIDRNKLERAKIQPSRQERQRVKRGRQLPEQAVQGRLKPEQIEHRQQQRSRDNVFNQVEDARLESQSSRRGKVSRQGSYNDPRSRNRSDSDDDSRGRSNNRNSNRR